MSKVSNSLRILLLLSKNRKMSGGQLARMLELSGRSVRKHINDLLMAGFMIHTIRGRNGGYFLETNPLWNSFLEQKELDKLTELVRKQLTLNPYDKVVQQLEEKLKQLSNQNDTVITSSYSVNTDFSHITFIKQQLKYCLEEQLQAVITYYSASSGLTTRTIHIYHFLQHNEHEYCIAYCEKKKCFLTFKLNRIERITISHQTFKKDASFSLKQFLGTNSLFNDPYNIELLVKKDIYIWFRDTKWAENQVITEYNEDYLFTGTMYGLPVIKQFILRFGASVCVLKPKELREEIEREIQKMQKNNFIPSL
ncbi:transcriptional regulator [Bacillus cereus]|uniref:helix-turn-helix transcriptional regulator n=1 Tax=Bacillus cereus TaxID=1396 RepID=UPI0018F73C36|nr:transcriptional regulator [Bacillus cereus]MBJ8054320.1 transcriptional regulator [Bacillus cereus]